MKNAMFPECVVFMPTPRRSRPVVLVRGPLPSTFLLPRDPPSCLRWRRLLAWGTGEAAINARDRPARRYESEPATEGCRIVSVPGAVTCQSQSQPPRSAPAPAPASCIWWDTFCFWARLQWFFIYWRSFCHCLTIAIPIQYISVNFLISSLISVLMLISNIPTVYCWSSDNSKSKT